MPDGFGRLIGDCLAAIERDAPYCAQALAQGLAGVAIELAIDAEVVWIHARSGKAEVGARPTGGARVQVRTGGLALLDIVEGRDELLDAVRANRLLVRAAPAHAGRLFDALRCFVEGAARTSDGPAALERFRQQAAPSGERTRP